MEPTEIVITGLRVWIGVVMLAHGINHGRNLDGTAKWFGSKGFALARRQAQASALGEVAIGAALIVGFLTSFASFGVVAIMTVAFWSIHRFAGFFVFRRPDEGYEYVATVALAAVVVATAGPGPLSVDALTGVADQLDGWPGLAVALGGLVAAAVQLGLSWRKPDG